jgi:glycosyltransferase involved in cell wall biosynthesis
LAAKLGIENDIDLPGFVSNPYAYMARAALFVLSSLWEGLGNVLVEALALGTPVVSTDCPSGPREVLQNGRYGPLVPVGDVDALVEAMLATLANPPDKAFLARAVRAYTVDMSSRQYLETLLGPNRGD